MIRELPCDGCCHKDICVHKSSMDEYGITLDETAKPYFQVTVACDYYLSSTLHRTRTMLEGVHIPDLLTRY